MNEELNHAKHDADAHNKFFRESGKFPLTTRGKLNTYSIFAELTTNLISSSGRVGIIIPPGIATDDSNKDFIQKIVNTSTLVSFYDFTNRGYIFNEIKDTLSFSLLTLSNSKNNQVSLAAQLWKVTDLKDPIRVYSLTNEIIHKLNPNTLNLPIIRTTNDATIITKIYDFTPVLENQNFANGNPWDIKFKQGLFNMTSDSQHFKIKSYLESSGYELTGNKLIKDNSVYLPLYESKLTDQYNHRFVTFEGIAETELYGNRTPMNQSKEFELINPDWVIIPRYWVSKQEIEINIPESWKYQWLVGFRNAISSVADSRTVRFTFIPRVGVGNSMPLIFSSQSPQKLSALIANFNSLVLDYITKQKASGGNLNFYVVKQLPIIPPERYTQKDIEYITPRVLELVYTSWDMQPFALDMGYNGEPFIWNPNKRALIRAELDAYYAKLYQLTRDELRYILDPADVYGADFPSETFRVLKNNEIKQFGEYRTQRLVLEAWDRIIRNS